MQHKKKRKIMKIKTFDIVFLIFLFVFVFRLFFSLQTAQFSDYTSYYGLRQIEYIAQHGSHIAYDELSYGGRDVLGIPLSFYILALFESLLGIYGLKIVSALMIASLIFITYIISKKITENEMASILAALCSGFIPIFVFKTLNNITMYSLVYPAIFLLIYSFYRIEEKFYLMLFIALTFFLPLMHPIAFLVAFSLVVYSVLCYVENIEAEGTKKDAVLLFILVTFLIGFMFYKKAFLVIGLSAIWQNIPAEILSEYFKGVNIFDMIINIGIIPLLFGVSGIYFAIKNKNKDVFVLISICVTAIILLITRLLDFSAGLVLLGITLSIIAAVGFDKFLKYITITKFSKHLNTIKFSLLIFIIITLIVPSMIGAGDIIKGTLTNEEVMPFLWIENNTALSSTVLADLDEGNLVTGIANRKSVFDANFLLVKDAGKIFEEATILFTVESEVKALELITKYDIDYIYLSENTKNKYNIKELKYGMDEKCFEKVFEDGSREIIKIIC